MIRFTVPGAPTGKGRPRFVKATGRAYTPKGTASRENAIAAAGMAAWRAPPADCPFALGVEVVMPVPKSWPQYKRAAALDGRIVPTVKPDADNIGKLVGDALNQIIWRDDCQIVRLTVWKRYGETPATIITVTPERTDHADPAHP